MWGTVWGVVHYYPIIPHEKTIRILSIHIFTYVCTRDFVSIRIRRPQTDRTYSYMFLIRNTTVPFSLLQVYSNIRIVGTYSNTIAGAYAYAFSLRN